MTVPHPSPATLRPNPTELVGIFLVSAASLALEICLTRILAVSLWYYFAFMVISTALFGVGLAGTALALRRDAGRIPSRLPVMAAMATPPAFVAGFALFNAIPLEPFSLATEPIQSLWLVVAFLAVTAPFLASGLTVGALLTRFSGSAHLVYPADLVGAGFGCIAALPVLQCCGGSGSVFAAAASAALGAALIAWTHSRRAAAATGFLALVLLCLVPVADLLLPIRITESKALTNRSSVADLFRDPEIHRYGEWNGVSRLDVVEFRDRTHPSLRHRTILIDAGAAATRLVHPPGPIDELGPTNDALGFFFQLFDSPRVAVLGSGGGLEVLSALRNGASEVVGVEVNPGINRIVGELMNDFCGGLAHHPRVRLATAEGRSWLRRQSAPFDLIVSPHTITNAGFAGGSLSLVEDFMMTRQAYVDFLDHLGPGGVFIMTRPETHLPRLVTTARAALLATGNDNPADSLMVWRSPAPGLSYFGGIAVRRGAFDRAEASSFRERLSRSGLEALYVPFDEDGSLYGRLVTETDPGAVVLPYPAMLEPATDERPIFNRRAPLRSLGWKTIVGVFAAGRQGLRAFEFQPVVETVLLIIAIETTIAATLLIGIPLWLRRRRLPTGRGSTVVFFGAIGIAYIVTELALLQRLSLFVGQPTLLVSTVVGTLLVGSGLGALLSGRLQSHPWLSVAALASCLAVGVTGAAAPLVTDIALDLPLGARLALTIGMLTPLGFVMGFPFPIAIRRLGRHREGLIPLAWAANGVGSVAGTVAAAAVGMAMGITATFAAGALLYILAAAAGWFLRRDG